MIRLRHEFGENQFSILDRCSVGATATATATATRQTGDCAPTASLLAAARTDLGASLRLMDPMADYPDGYPRAQFSCMLICLYDMQAQPGRLR